ncbi:MAG: glutamate-cysteine ligase family protein [Actinomycetota bacterium]
MTRRRGTVEGVFRYGIEHETALLRPDGRFADFTNTAFEELQAIIDMLPLYEEDYPGLRVVDRPIKVKRWYVEGFERFGPRGELLRCDPKGIETRTPIRDSIVSAVSQLEADFALLASRALTLGFRPVGIGHNPHSPRYLVEPELNGWEKEHRRACPEDRTAHLHMTTYGPDLNISWSRLEDAELVDVGAKLTYYSPYIVPFSFSSPFYEGQLWGGLSVRTYIRTGVRPAVLVFLAGRSGMVCSDPSLTRLSRVEAEAGRIEFKAFDACWDLGLYADLLTLVKGLVVDERLDGRRVVPDAELHRVSAWAGFDDPEIRAGAETVLNCAEAALSDARDLTRMQRLWRRLEARACPARQMIERYNAGEKVADVQKI